MNTVLAPAAVLTRVFGAEHCVSDLESVNAGLTNQTFFIHHAGRRLVLRIDTQGARLLGLDRSVELAVLQQASAAGVAPGVFFADPAAGILVCEYLPGRALDVNDLTMTGTLEAMAEVLQKVHALPECGKSFAGSAIAARYVDIVRPAPDLYAFAMHCADNIAEIPAADRTRCCHNDIVAGNVILDPATSGKLRLIDWEYACDNDPLFDLASLIGYHDIAAAPTEILLSAYSGGADADDRERLALQLRFFDLLQWLWLAARQVLAPKPLQLDRLRELRRRIA